MCGVPLRHRKESDYMYYVYEWYIEETGEIIYVGKGTRNRYKARKHNNFFNDMITRFRCSSRIVREFETEEEAFNYEYDRINEFKAKGQCVCNLANGGYGGNTKWWTDERRQWYSEHNAMKSEIQRKRMSVNNPMKNRDVVARVVEKKKRKVCVENRTYDSLLEVSKAYNVSPQLFLYWIERGYTNRQERCFYYGETPTEIKILGHGNTAKIMVLVDGIRYNSIREAAAAIGCNGSYLSKALRKNKPVKGHTCSYVH